MIDKELLALLGGNKKYIFICAALSLSGLLAGVAVTTGICLALDGIIKGERLSASYLLAGGLILAGIAVRFVSTLLSGKFRSFLSAAVKKDLREKLYDKVLRLNETSAEQLGAAGLTQVAIEGIEQLDLYYTSYLPQFFFAVSAPFVLFAVCAFVNLKAAAVLLACVPLIPVSIILMSKYAKKIFAKYWDKYASMGDGFLDSVQGLKELKIFDADGARNDLMNKNAEEFRRITMKVLVMQLFSVTVMDLVAFGGAGAGIAVDILTGAALNPAAVLFLVLIAAEFFLPLRAFGSAFHVAMNGATAGKKILTLLKTDEPEWGDAELDGGGEIVMSKVSFSYDGLRLVLSDADMRFEENKLTAIAGESGSGKSTIVKLLTGAKRPTAGSVTIGGRPLASLSREGYYDNLAVVGCDTYIFNDTVRNNFLPSAKSADDADIWAALKKVNLDGFVRENGGLDKPISEDAVNLSGGQKQRLALAVNLASPKRIYIFDEATSNIDVESEAIIMRNITALKSSATVVMISHRLANAEGADMIYVIDGGEVKERGRHAELMKTGGVYSRLYTAQKALESGYREGEKNA
ncbi:MAG: ABC transporter ATP-binding protein/permease [Clostridiales bacterium]|jgi:ABC-type transport system involved in cytochrome bd biosynthesis fused ATPase/permease subunit|nr:ABC transporter ATP-binding protein/permease [Clostridiales bacterium]